MVYDYIYIYMCVSVPINTKHRNSNISKASAAVTPCLFCCVFTYFPHKLSVGMRPTPKTCAKARVVVR